LQKLIQGLALIERDDLLHGADSRLLPVRLRDAARRLNPYGNSLIVNGEFLKKNTKLVEDFVKISQKAFAACVANVDPCLKALLDQVSGLDEQVQRNQWERIKYLMTDEFTTTKALGWIDGERMKKDYELVQTYLGMEKPFPVENAFTTRMLDTSIKMDASKVKQ
jgi:NitT/TauT family transport system substrate-binding protein